MGKAKAFPICKSEVTGMKRAVLLMLVLLLLTACGAPAAEPTPEATADAAPPGVTVPADAHRHPYSSSPTNISASDPDWPYYLPPMDFTPASVWRAEPFGSDGQALLYMGEEENGTTPFKLYFCFNQDRGAYPVAPGNLATYCFSSELADGSFSYECADPAAEFEIWPITGIAGRFEFLGKRLTLSYDTVKIHGEERGFDPAGSEPRIVLQRNDTGFVKYISFPTEFTRVYDDYIGRVMYSMPVFYEELVFAPNSGETAALYDERGKGYTSSDPATAPTLRALEIGDGLDDILRRIPVRAYMECDLSATPLDPSQLTLGEAGIRLYGAGQDMSYYATLFYEDGRPGSVLVHCLDATYISSELDGDGKLASATYYQWNPQ